MEERHGPAEVSGGQVANFQAADARMSDLAPGAHGLGLIARIQRVHPHVCLTLNVLLASAGYYLGGVVGIAVMFPDSPIAIIWPPNAIFLAVLLLTSARTWWVRLLAAIPTHLHPDLAMQFKIRVIPTLLLFTHGVLTEFIVGMIPTRFPVKTLSTALGVRVNLNTPGGVTLGRWRSRLPAKHEGGVERSWKWSRSFAVRAGRRSSPTPTGCGKRRIPKPGSRSKTPYAIPGRRCAARINRDERLWGRAVRGCDCTARPRFASHGHHLVCHALWRQPQHSLRPSDLSSKRIVNVSTNLYRSNPSILAAGNQGEEASCQAGPHDSANDGERRNGMNLIVWLIVGGILGWIASKIMHTDAQQGIVLNIVVGVIGALLAGLLLTPLFGLGTINQGNFSLASLLLSLLGAIILLAIVNLVRRGAVR
jgi:uncharacterized membrane protein YeaQ/YmgE (transglycosylase-associated protein family)